jgi:uncharacterized protein YggE
MNPSPFPRLFALALVVLLPLAARAQPEADPSLITVSGQAEIRVAPDEVLFRLDVEKMDKDLMTAQRMNDESVRQILALARRFGVPAQDVKTDFISVEMKYSTDLAGDDEDDADTRRLKREFVGYQVEKTVIIRFTDLRRFDELFSELLKAGVSSVRGVEFRTSQIRKYKDQARALAIRAAREKAQALAAEIGQTIGKAHTISEEGRNASSNSFSNATGTIGGSFSDDEESSFAPGMISVTASVSVRFRLN